MCHDTPNLQTVHISYIIVFLQISYLNYEYFYKQVIKDILEVFEMRSFGAGVQITPTGKALVRISPFLFPIQILLEILLF